MQKHKRLFLLAIVLITALAVLFSFTACDDDDDDDNHPASTTSESGLSIDDQTAATIVASALAQAVTDGIEFSATGTVGDITLGENGSICIEVDGVVFDSDNVTVTFEYGDASVTVDAEADANDDGSGCVVTIEEGSKVGVYAIPEEKAEESDSSYIYLGLNGSDSAVILSDIESENDNFKFTLAEGVTLTVSGTGHAPLTGTYASLDCDSKAITLSSDYTTTIGSYSVTVSGGSSLTIKNSNSVTVDAYATIDGERADVSFVYAGEVTYLTVNGLFSYIEEDETSYTTETTVTDGDTVTVTTVEGTTVNSIVYAADYLIKAVSSSLKPVSLTATVTGESAVKSYTYTNGTFGDITVSFTSDGVTYSIDNPVYGEAVEYDGGLSLVLTFSDGTTASLRLTLGSDKTYSAMGECMLELTGASTVETSESSESSSETDDDGNTTITVTTTTTTTTTIVYTITADDEDGNNLLYTLAVDAEGNITIVEEEDAETYTVTVSAVTDTDGNTAYTYTYTTVVTTSESTSTSAAGSHHYNDIMQKRWHAHTNHLALRPGYVNLIRQEQIPQYCRKALMSDSLSYVLSYVPNALG